MAFSWAPQLLSFLFFHFLHLEFFSFYPNHQVVINLLFPAFRVGHRNYQVKSVYNVFIVLHPLILLHSFLVGKLMINPVLVWLIQFPVPVWIQVNYSSHNNQCKEDLHRKLSIFILPIISDWTNVFIVTWFSYAEEEL